MQILVLNGGSSSIKGGLYSTASTDPRVTFSISRIGERECTLYMIRNESSEIVTEALPDSDYANAITTLFTKLSKFLGTEKIDACAHRFVHSGTFTNHTLITAETLEILSVWIPYVPHHLPQELALAEECMRVYPTIPHVACFDSIFHRTMPPAARLIPLPKEYRDHGAQRYGFHGLSYEYLAHETETILGEKAKGRVVIAHLGSGASVAALLNGKSIDTSMGFSPSSGISTSARSGDIDPTLPLLIQSVSPELSLSEIVSVLTTESGLNAITSSKNDMRALVDLQHTDENAALAVSYFCYSVQKYIGAYAAALGGIDALVFSGGIGEVSSELRARITTPLEFLGISIDPNRNKENNEYISTKESAVSVLVIPTREDLTMVRICTGILGV